MSDTMDHMINATWTDLAAQAEWTGQKLAQMLERFIVMQEHEE